MAVNFVYHPQHAVYFHVVPGRETVQLAVTCEQDTSGVTLGKGECETVVNRESRGLPDHGLRPEDPLARKFDDLESGANEPSFLCRCEFEKFIVEERVGYQEFTRQPQ